MAEPIITAGSPATHFLPKAISQVEAGLRQIGFEMCSAQDAMIELNLNATQSVDDKGNITIYIVEIGSSKSTTVGQSIKIHARRIPDSAEESIRKYEEIQHERELERAREHARQEAKPLWSRI
ncbi:hypothetical protein HYV81_04965 [Candidatus Woesearchaeota archaeon]|nr:hypothetical protein [Candidatus Woesearchaeota archaeon]